MKRLYVGTEQGLQVLSEDAEGWCLDHSLLADYEVSSVVKRNTDGRLYVATRQGGLFLVDPRSGACDPVGAGVLPQGLRCITVSATDPNLMYVGCEPASIFKSRDGGKSWQECAAVAELARARNWQYHIPRIPPHVRQILIDRRSPDRLYAAIQIGGVILSEDGGQTWIDVTDSIDPDVHAITQDPLEADVLYAATGGGGPIGGPHPPVAPNGYALYRSDDAGKSWRPISDGLDRQHGVPLHMYPRDPNTIVAAVARGTPIHWRKAGGADAILVVSPDRGKTWNHVAAGLPPSFQTMVDSIDTEPGPAGRTYIGIGGEGTKVLPPESHHGSVYYAERLAGPWTKLPREFPTVFTVTAG
jgi:photosystem II stability/assembly factor-like uncharacterized protein